ncbi:hypothetical protein MTR67_017583 [Solanum verrucosum]|uniref:Uncharacterized protein n=1 Tax=Solanum verrucosum TaxID=315347 RepID=A0AAF0QKQ8_SOLVR|nr:hypothetical protein MTR67_017583 [Solanum verrucosum]
MARKKEFSTKWKDIIRSKKQGGLGIRNLKHQGKALKIKWLWRYAQEPQTLWGSVIKSKYGEEDCRVSKEVTTPYGVNQHNTVAEMWTQQGWDMRFRRGMNVWEIPRVVELFKQLESFQGMQEGVDCCGGMDTLKDFIKSAQEAVLTHEKLIKRKIYDQDVYVKRKLRQGIAWALPSKIADTLFSWEEAGASNRER